MASGRLRIYLGAAPGVGKTYDMLCEAQRRKARGTDVVVGLVETHGRPRTAALLDGLEIMPRRTVSYRGATFTEMDVDAILARAPAVVLVDELAHTTVPGCRNAKRWQDVHELLNAGIDVLSTLNIQHLESLNDVVERITGVPQRETVPDAVVRAAEQVELVDMTPEALRRRMVHGNIYGPDKVDAALGNYFRVGNLTALRELALLWLADKVDEQLDHYRTEHQISGIWETRERVVVALTGGPEGDTLIRRAARIADRAKGADLLAVHVTRSDGLAGASPAHLARQRVLVESLGGSYHQVVGDDIPIALLEFARAENATQLVLGASRRGRLAHMIDPGIGVTTTKLSGPIDVHLVTHEEVGKGRLLPRRARGLTLRRRLAGVLAAVVLLPLLTLALTHQRTGLNLTSNVLGFLIVVVAVALVGGLLPALLAAVGGLLLLNYYFIQPVHRFIVAESNNVLALLAFLAVAVMVSSVVDLAARRTSQAVRATAEAEMLSTLAGSVLRGEQALPALLTQVRETFGLTSVALLERAAEGGQNGARKADRHGWRVVDSAGPDPCLRPDEADTEVPVSENLTLVLRGRPLPAADRRVLTAFAAQAAVALEQRRLAQVAAEAGPLAEADRTRRALLTAVSHDLRSPLATASAAVANLRGNEVEWSAEEQAELLATAEEALDHLARLVENLLDMSRLQAGRLSVFPAPVGLDDVIPGVLRDLGPAARDVAVTVPDDLPLVYADPALLERVIANLLSNAARYSPPGQPPLITASALHDRIQLRVIDRGPGLPAEDRDQAFTPFQRLGDTDNASGIGLGLALSRGLTEAMGGTLTPEDTPGGGLTMVVALPVATVGDSTQPADGAA
ncbi:osmosensitive K+ channel signal transduction histidine kinase [Frankia casuarinae]|uniref:histidine kinase n=1 Tax=Frankia casuarinae (strain DSM 45818 / CECT 9043 / HFP020203 / CcI3) TaxID=106370 RepID=Q2J7V2_FRACC|nr:ATP-binding protein [Frankia casuarinae]ABD12640.1 osmosensitive K+ channel signal transduction histidine kinase [Frankia casuarinae]EYT91518.1 osmosensitive K+ channel signal transduction histidine kinase [Frankia casuarinae]